MYKRQVLDVLVEKTFKLAKERASNKIVLAGGVASNSGIRRMMEERGLKENISIFYPNPILCTDNAAMIACAAYYKFLLGKTSDLYLNAIPNVSLSN